MSLLLTLSKIKHNPKMAGVRKWTNLLYYDPNCVNIDVRNFDVVEVDGCKFKVSDQINAVQRVKGNDWFDRMRPTDVVVDIGANIGAMTIPLAKMAKKVVAVEPVYHRELENNIKLNNLTNVRVLKVAIGKPKTDTVSFGQKSVDKVTFISFEWLRRMATPIDVLKMDGEGCEWDIEPSELKGIRELRIEFHIARDTKREHLRLYKRYLDWMKSEGYEVHETDDGAGLPNPYFIGHPEVRASLR